MKNPPPPIWILEETPPREYTEAPAREFVQTAGAEVGDYDSDRVLKDADVARDMSGDYDSDRARPYRGKS